MEMENGDSVKDMTSKFEHLIKFEWKKFCRWQKNMHFLLTTLNLLKMKPWKQLGGDQRV